MFIRRALTYPRVQFSPADFYFPAGPLMSINELITKLISTGGHEPTATELPAGLKGEFKTGRFTHSPRNVVQASLDDKLWSNVEKQHSLQPR